MNILYASTLCSTRFLQYLYDTGKKKPTYSIQKFHRLLAKGFIANGCQVDTITSVPCARMMYDKYIFCPSSESEDGIRYHYAFCLNVKVLKNICDYLGSFIFTLYWCLRHRRGVVFCDILNVSICMGALLAAKLCRNHASAIVTDMPGLMVGNNSNMRIKLASYLMMSYVNSFNSYTLLTEQMNERVNLKRRPYIVMEGLVSSEMRVEERNPVRKPRIIIYAGGLHERYGIKMLIEAFDELSSDYPDAQLHLFGDGPLVSYIKERACRNKQIVFHGVMPNTTVVESELKATLLVNPRPTHEDFTKYSFPSKNMEYMVSGTPVLTTKLPGMPQEYYPHVFILEEETVAGCDQSLREILSLSDAELDAKGRSAKRFVLDTKNNIMQAERVKLLVSGII